MEKKRIYQVAKDFHVSSEALLSLLRDLKFDVKSHMSIVEDNMLKSITDKFKKQRAEVKKNIQKRKQISEAISVKKDNKPANQAHTRDNKKKTPHRNSGNMPPKNNSEKKPPLSKKRREQERKARAKSRKEKMKTHRDAVQNSFRKTMASMSTDTKVKSKKSRSRNAATEEVEVRQVVKVTEFVTVAELAKQMDMPTNTLIAKCVEMGMMVSVNQPLDMDSITLITDEFGYEVEQLGEFAEDVLKARDEEAVNDEDVVERPPVVTVMGHVDHGKTTLLDYIRNTNVVSGEAGGITQHIGAYSVELPNGQVIAFIDTPGHEAFTAMRARGAKATDIVILIIGADDSVMPQTIEAIDHAKEAEVPIVIAINKVDLPNADPEKIKGDLARHNVLVEDWGGTYQCQEISAKNGDNIDKLLAKVLLESEMLELSADSSKNASGVIIDSNLDKGRGPVATVLVQSGTLHTTDSFITGMITGRVRAMFNEYGESVESAGPSIPIQIFGMNGVPKAGDTFYAVDSESEAKMIAQQRRLMKKEQASRRIKRVTLNDIYDKIQDGLIKELKLVIKADVDGSMEALSDSLSKITHDEVRVRVIHQGVGGIRENDVILAAASDAIIIGFHVRPSVAARALAEKESVEIKIYEIIYEAIEDVEKALSGLLTPKVTENLAGTVEIRDVIKIPKVGNVAGCFILTGHVKRNSRIKLFRDNIEIYTGKISSLKRFKEDVSDVNQGYECGLSIEGYSDIKVGDIVEVVEYTEEARTV